MWSLDDWFPQATAGSIALNLVTDIGSSIDSKAGNAIRANGARIFVVLLGGCSVSEMQSIYDLTRETHRQVVLVTTSILQRDQWHYQLSQVKLDGKRSNGATSP